MNSSETHHRHPGDRRRGRRDDIPYLGIDFGGGYPGRRRGRRRGGRGGDVRAAALLLLAEQPAHGYQLIQEIADLSRGAWTPSPGSIYPVLQQLEDEGLVEFERVDGRKTATLTDAGREYVEEHRDELGKPWDDAVRGDERTAAREAGEALKGMVVAWRQVMHAGSADQQAQASKVLDDARRAMYGILANDES
jgi:DNA-binding PadR family transcriptional regulator